RGSRRARQAGGLREPLWRRFLRPRAQPGHDHAAAQGVDRAENAALRRRGARPAARRRNDPVAIGLNHPIFDSVRPWIEKAGDFSTEQLNLLSEQSNLKTES